MALTLSLSPQEFQRVSVAAYEGRRMYVFLANLAAEGYNSSSTVAAWETLKPSGNGYTDYKELTAVGSYDTSDQRYEQGGQVTGGGFIDALFSASSAGVGYTYNTVVVVVQDNVNENNLAYVLIENNVATITTEDEHGLSPGDEIVIENAVNSIFNGTFSIVTCPTPSSFTFNLTAANISSTASTGTVKKFTSNTYPHSIFSESPSVTIAPGQTMMYRIQIVLDD